jgi:hypothetical protein
MAPRRSRLPRSYLEHRDMSLCSLSLCEQLDMLPNSCIIVQPHVYDELVGECCQRRQATHTERVDNSVQKERKLCHYA